MQVFVSEYVCGGGWSHQDLPPSLEREGLTMLRSIMTDFARIPDCHVVTTLDRRRPYFERQGVRILRVTNPNEERQVFQQLAAECDACLVIAPELENVLHDRCDLARRAGAARLLNPESATVELCSDKFKLAQFFAKHDLPTIETSLLGDECSLSPRIGPVVVKPRYGAGSQDLHTLPCLEDAMKQQFHLACSGFDAMIVQPLIRGTAVSVGVLCQTQPFQFEIFPTGRQHLSSDGTFAYLGGSIPFVSDTESAVRSAVRRACSHLEGLAGYVGFDLIVPDDDPIQPLIVEINPRLTTSYLGYRSLTPDNLALRMLGVDPVTGPIRWNEGHVRFTPGGEVTRSSGVAIDAEEYSGVHP